MSGRFDSQGPKAAEYVDADGRYFWFFVLGAQVYCYESLVRVRNWDKYPQRTRETLGRIVGWLKMAIPVSHEIDPTKNFRVGALNRCTDCPQMST